MSTIDGNPIADPTDPLLGWASETELTLSQTLPGHNLVAAVGFKADELERLERFYGAFVARQRAAGADATALLSITPCLAVATLVSRASRMIDRDEFYTEWIGGLGIAEDHDFAAAAESLGATMLVKTGVTAASELAHPVDVWALHAGATAAEIPWLIELFDSRAVESGDTASDEDTDAVEAAAAAIADALADGSWTQWAHCAENDDTDGEDDSDGAYPAIGRNLAVARDLATGARDVFLTTLAGIDRLRRASATRPSTWRRDIDPEAGGLVRLVFDEVAAELRERPAGSPNRSWAVGVATREVAPRIVFDPVRNKVCLRLPEQKLAPGGGDIHWRVTLDGTTRIHRTGAGFGTSGQYTEPLDLAIDKQTREVTVTDVTNAQTWVLPVVDTADPALIFTPKGFNLTAKASLHYAQLIVVAPADATIVDPVTGAAIETAATVPLKGWSGWSVRRVDTAEAAGIKICDPSASNSSMAHARCVDPRQRVHFVDPEDPIDGLTSASGLPVHTASLVAEFPPTVSGHDERWWLSISAYAGTGRAGEEVAPPEPIDVPAAGGAFDVFDPEVYDEPWTGEYVVRLRGPRNESFRHQYAIVEGLHAEPVMNGASPSARIPAGRGLTPAQLVLRAGEKPLTATPSTLVVDSDQSANVAVIETDGGDRLPVRWTPPRLTFELPLVDAPTLWRTTRLHLRPRGLSPDGRARLRLRTGMEKPCLQARNRHGLPIATVKLTTDNNVTFMASTSSLAAALATQQTATLSAEWVDPATHTKVSVIIAEVAPQPIPVAATITSSPVEELTSDTDTDTGTDTGTDTDTSTVLCVTTDTGEPVPAGTGLWVWPASAPWEFGRTLVVDDDGRCALPADLVDAGELTLQPHAADPFTSQRAPLTPGATAFPVPQPGYFTGGRPELEKLSEFLAGQAETAPDDPAVAPILWDVLASMPASTTTIPGPVDAASSTVDGDTAQPPAPVVTNPSQAVLTALRAHPTAALKGLSHSLVPAHLLPGRLVGSGLVHCRFTGDDPATEVHRTAWIGCIELLARLEHAHNQAQAATENTDNADNADNVDNADETEEITAALTRNTAPPVHTATRRAILKELKEVAGERLIDTLHTGRDTTLETACVDQATVQIAHMDPTQQKALLEMFFHRADIVPGPIMDDGARLMAVFETFDRRNELSTMLADRELITAAVKLLKALRGTNRQLYSAARVRFDKLGGVDTADQANIWALAPVVSMVFALAARMHAHGLMEKSKLIDQARAGWVKLADTVPDLVTGDIIAAEAMVLAVTHPGIGG